MNTPAEQLARWREEFEKPTHITTPMLAILLYKRELDSEYSNNYVEAEWRGYLRAQQETEQAVKDACKQALEAVLALSQYRPFHDGERTISESEIKELLNDCT